VSWKIHPLVSTYTGQSNKEHDWEDYSFLEYTRMPITYYVESFVSISVQTATFTLYIINWLVFITVVESVYSAVRSDALYKADYI